MVGKGVITTHTHLAVGEEHSCFVRRVGHHIAVPFTLEMGMRDRGKREELGGVGEVEGRLEQEKEVKERGRTKDESMEERGG